MKVSHATAKAEVLIASFDSSQAKMKEIRRKHQHLDKMEDLAPSFIAMETISQSILSSHSEAERLLSQASKESKLQLQSEG